MKKKNTILRQDTEFDTQTGEIMKTRHTVQYPAEPQFVKLYLDCLGMFSGNAGLDKSLNDMLLETLRYMTYADNDQRIYLNSEIKKNICQKTGKSLARYNQALTLWVKENVLIRDGRSTYKVNPFIFGRGDWRDISDLRATFNFKTGEVTTEKRLKPRKPRKKTDSAAEPSDNPAPIAEAAADATKTPDKSILSKSEKPETVICPACGEEISPHEYHDQRIGHESEICYECPACGMDITDFMKGEKSA